jgi:phenol 2-monooxygenase
VEAGGVLRGTAKPELLHTYSDERQKVAQQLIDFDREFSKMFSAHPTAPATTSRGVDPEAFQEYFTTQGRFTAGVATRYEPSMITAPAMFQHLAEGFPSGCASTPPRSCGWPTPSRSTSGTPRGPTAPGGCTSSPTATTRRARIQLRQLCTFLASDASPLKRFTPAGPTPTP